MARPTLGEGPSERLNMMISKDEIEAINEWRWNNRIPSLSEAVRRLIKAGLEVTQERA